MPGKVVARLWILRTGILTSLLVLAVNLGLSRPIPWLYLLCMPGLVPVLMWGRPRHRVMGIALLAFSVFLAGWTWWAAYQRQVRQQKVRESQEFRIVIPPDHGTTPR